MCFCAPILSAAVGVLGVPADYENNNAEADLTAWFTSMIDSFFPDHTGWDTSYAQAFNQTLVASFNLPAYDDKGLQGLYGKPNEAVTSDDYDVFAVTFTSITTLLNAGDAGGQAVATGLLSGYKNGTIVETAQNGLFVTISIVDGERKITEWKVNIVSVMSVLRNLYAQA
ncbi:hypothetical protein DFH07DRAFT_773719 [Mycena maculata]|uniref:SnoaL-like domain-containing protein n=1 Tax=Mycena maculata TaxID=230809 RepID=A0AAD7J3G9_9AGAR|nr:hypothetical protein DFH07DRAFT_773719 [Mycena maculata]